MGDTIQKPGGDAGVVRIHETKKAIAASIDSSALYCYAHPLSGGKQIVCESWRNLVSVGAKPIAITNCLNFGNPYNPEVYWQFVGAIKGMTKSCKKFNTPVTGGNVSFYNQSAVEGTEVPVFPTPTIGMLGIVEDKKHITSLAFKGKSDLIYLLGKCENDISSSEYLASFHGVKESPAPNFDLDVEYELQQTITKLIRAEVLESAHDVADGGLFITLLESAMHKNLGFDITSCCEVREDALLFGEAPSRVVVSVCETTEDKFLDLLKASNTTYMLLGHVTKGDIRIDDKSFGDISEYKEIYDNALAKKLK